MAKKKTRKLRVQDPSRYPKETVLLRNWDLPSLFGGSEPPPSLYPKALIFGDPGKGGFPLFRKVQNLKLNLKSRKTNQMFSWGVWGQSPHPQK